MTYTSVSALCEGVCEMKNDLAMLVFSWSVH